MKNIALTFILCLCVCFGKSQTLDISIMSQQYALKDTTIKQLAATDSVDTSIAEFIQETYQIPCYGLYDKFWDIDNISSRFLQVPFDGNPLRIILVQSNNNDFFYPCHGLLKNKYGASKSGFHPGVDFALAFGSPVKNCFDGVVRMAKIYGDYGKVVVVRHYNGLETVYANLSKIMVSPGQIVQAGDVVGASGKSVKNGVEMLHFETRFMNECFDPELFIDFEIKELKDNTLILSQNNLAIGERQYAEQQESKEVGKKTDENKVVTQGAYHIVKQGETMYRIALQHNIPLARLLQINNMRETDTITVGQKIKLE